MELLPKSFSEFSTESYWNDFFHKRGLSFEWYGEYDQLKELLHKYIKKSDNLLTIGCGNSDVSYKLYLDGVVNNMNIDISEMVIYQMNTKYGGNDGLHFVKMDVFNMEFKDQSYNVVLDKGTLDTIAAENTLKSLEDVERMFAEIDRVLKICGRYLSFSLLQPYILEKLLSWFSSKRNYIIRIHRCFAAETSFPVFLVVCTKLTKEDDHLIELALAASPSAKPTKTDSVALVMNSIADVQKYSFFRTNVRKEQIPENSEVCFQLFSTTDSVNPRYSFFVQDFPKEKKRMVTYSIFIVPEGRETEWLFGSQAGRKSLLDMANSKRVVVVHLNRNHKYESLDTVKKELSAKVMDFAPEGAKAEEVPFLSLGEDLGKRVVRFRGSSKISGDLVVEDVSTSGDEVLRRLIFMANSDVIQSEAKLKTDAKSKCDAIDHRYLSCQHHYAIVGGLALANNLPKSPNSSPIKVLLIGLGGGCLASFIHRYVRLKTKIALDIVDIDPEIVNIAKNWYEFKPDGISSSAVDIHVHINDGIKYIQSKVESKEVYDVVIFDVDNKDLKIGLSCPPESFVEPRFLKDVHKLVSSNNGVFILNLVARNKDLKAEITKRIASHFQTVLTYQVPDDLNEVLYCISSAEENKLSDDWKSKMDSWIQGVLVEKELYDDFPDLCSDLQLLKL